MRRTDNVHSVRTLGMAAAGLALAGACSLASASEREVQIRSIDFNAGLIELHNFGATDIDLSGSRFCTHDFDQPRRYTAAGGFDGYTIEAGTSVFVHLFNDIFPSDPDRVRADVLGGSFASPFGTASYSMQIYIPTTPGGAISFGNASLIADHLQWSDDDSSVGQATTRSGQAVGQGLWSAAGDFIEVQSDTDGILLLDDTGGLAHAPVDYQVGLDAPCVPDLSGDGVLNNTDINLFVSAFLAMDPAADINADGNFNNTDINQFVAAFLAGCD